MDGVVVVPGVRSEADAEAVRVALARVPVAGADRAGVGAALLGFATGAAWSTLDGLGPAVLALGNVPVLIGVFLLALLTGFPLGRSRPGAPAVLRVVAGVGFVGSVALWGGVLGLFARRATGVSGGVVRTVVAVVAVAGLVQLVGWWRERSAPSPVWPQGSEVVAVLAVLAGVNQYGIHPRQLSRLTGLEAPRAAAALDHLGGEGLLQGEAGDRASGGGAVLVNLSGRDRLVQYRRALGLTPVALVRRAARRKVDS